MRILEKHPINPKVVSTLVLILVVAIRVSVTTMPAQSTWDFLLVAPFVFAVSTLLVGTKIEGIFTVLGDHCMNMWLTHTFWCYYYFQEFVFLPKVSTLVCLWLVLLSLGTSYLINLIYTPLKNVVCRRFASYGDRQRDKIILGNSPRLSYQTICDTADKEEHEEITV